MRWGAVLLACAVFAGCGVKEEVYLRDTNALKDQISTLEAQKGDLVAQRKRLKDELDALGQIKGTLDQDLQDTKQRMEDVRKRMGDLKRQADERKIKLSELKDKLKSMVAAGQLKVRTYRGRMLVEMAEKVLFDTGRHKLKEEGLEALAVLTPLLRSIENREFQVAGYTDSVGPDDMNWKLSLDRAREVVLYMVEMGMPADRISATGYGENQPVADNETDEGRALNRRIEIVLQPNMDEILGFEE